MNKIGLNKQTGWSIHEQEQDSDQIILISLTKLKGEKVKALPWTEQVHADLLHGHVQTVVEDGGCRRQVIQRWGILGCWGGGQLPLGGSNLLRRIWDCVLALPMPPHHLLRGWKRGPLRRLRDRCGGVGTRAGGGGIHRESTGLGVAATVVEWEATEADGDLRAVAGEEELDAGGSPWTHGACASLDDVVFLAGERKTRRQWRGMRKTRRWQREMRKTQRRRHEMRPSRSVLGDVGAGADDGVQGLSVLCGMGQRRASAATWEAWERRLLCRTCTRPAVETRGRTIYRPTG
ncbi:unnamed protein product [Miscanthus lutarioriparius]|uniref:Uncharacterized protein n=1 Tax=Miscanthus lutarioriparius TaxID=422564 RepID=A0A811PQ32_9POAL|nr:unnamed protein product [Miscanthus lutarioriparius]